MKLILALHLLLSAILMPAIAQELLDTKELHNQQQACEASVAIEDSKCIEARRLDLETIKLRPKVRVDNTGKAIDTKNLNLEPDVRIFGSGGAVVN